jgi:hypothetical protein
MKEGRKVITEGRKEGCAGRKVITEGRKEKRKEGYAGMMEGRKVITEGRKEGRKVVPE